ncbi:DUF4238 domain-containing protein [Cohaesibacter marisflavi]|uniref:DUF4238 domain-containing protein n=1 Tax=Cohaesibacter marisflavi TaxID=655353 RepID=UPI0029C6214F|nr:DUF4238 domain-containing protein [Cohaesibacter marisflavi]
MTDRAVNHHIVPEVLQKQFSINGERVRVWRSKRDNAGLYPPPEKKKISKSFVTRDYNTILKGTKPSDHVEKEFYGRVDDFLGRWLPEVENILQNRSVPAFNPGALVSVREMVKVMLMRTPDFANLSSDIEIGKDVVESSILARTHQGPESQSASDLLSILDDKKQLAAIGRDIRVRGTVCGNKKISAVLSEFFPHWAVSSTNHSFILSSRMVYRVGNGGSNGLLNPNMEIWFPISPKIALVLTRNINSNIPLICSEPPEHIRQVNLYAVKSSYEVASHSEKLLSSLLRSR